MELEYYQTINEILNQIEDVSIYESFVIARNKMRQYSRIMCSVSGGSDSDIVIDLISKLDPDKKVDYVFFDTGLEYQATKEHLKKLENKYNITIEKKKAEKPIPLCVRQYGQPFISKYVSEMIQRLQRHNFKWENKPFDELIKLYPDCRSALMWWCDEREGGSKFGISRNKYLKEFMILNPPDFKISNKCCDFAKKKGAGKYKKEKEIELSITGVRKAEGGIRASAYKNCFTAKDDESDEYRPIFWYQNDTKKVYEDMFDITHSKCYSEYGLKRTGCAGCPFGKDFEKEIEVIKNHEPKLYKAVNKIFGKSYEYTRAYKKFVENQKNENQLSFFDDNTQ